MSLKIRDDIREKYNDFYLFAQGAASENVLNLVNITSENVQNLKDFSAEFVYLKKSPLLKDFDFLKKFSAAKFIGVFDCKAFVKMWDISFNKELKGVAIVNCGKLNDIATFEYKQNLEHIFINSPLFSAPCLQSLAPLVCQKELLTLDLAVKKCEDKKKIEFDLIWPLMESLTITPNMRKYFKSQNEV